MTVLGCARLSDNPLLSRVWFNVHFSIKPLDNCVFSEEKFVRAIQSMVLDVFGEGTLVQGMSLAPLKTVVDSLAEPMYKCSSEREMAPDRSKGK